MADKRISQLVDRGTVANNDVVPIVVSGAVTTNKATISSIQTFMQGNLDFGVTSVGITLGSSGTDVSVSGSPITTSGNITINIPTASASNRGLLSSADWITFNAKQPAGNYVTLDTAQTITAQKTFTTSGSSDTMIISHGSGSGFALDVIKAGNNEAIRVTKTSGSGNAMSVIGGVLSTEGISVNTPANGLSTIYNGRSSDSVNILRFNNSGASSLQNFIQSTPTDLIIGSQGNTPIYFVTNNGGGGGIRMSIGGSGAVSIFGALQGTSASFSAGVTLTSDAGTNQLTTLQNTSAVHSGSSGSNRFGFNGNNNIYFSKGLANGGIIAWNNAAARTYTLPDADGTIALTSNLNAYLPLTGGTLTGALNGTSASFTGAVGAASLSGAFATLSNFGSATSTALQLGDANNGLFRPALNSVAIATNGSAALTIASTGAATFSSTARIEGQFLQVINAAQPSVYINNTAVQWRSYLPSNNYAFSDAVRDVLTLGYNGSPSFFQGCNVGIGTSSPAEKLDVIGGALAAGNGTIRTGITYSSIGLVGTFTNHDLGIISNGSERMRITSGGDVGIGTASPTRRLQVEASPSGGIEVGRFVNNSNSEINDFVLVSILGSNGNSTSSFHYIAATGAADKLYIFGNGNVVNTNNSYGSLSDAKLKENIEDATPKLDDLMKVKVRNYNLIGDDKKQIGVIAQELEEVFPAMIDESEDFEEVEVPQLDEEGNEVLNEEGEVLTEKQRVSKGTSTKSVKYSVFVPMLIKAIQELKTEIDSLKNQMQ